MSTFIEGLGQAAATQASNGIVGTALGLITGGMNDSRQIRQQKKLNELQLDANKNMAMFNYDQQMKMWEATNYSAQREQLEKAGLNPGLLYGMGGGGGATTNAAQGQGTGGSQAPAGGGEQIAMMQQGMQMQLMQAQKANIEADTQNKLADIPNKQLTGANIQASTASLTQGINNAKAQEALTKIETSLKTIQNAYADQREGYTNEILAQQLDNMAQQWVSIKYENDITKQTWQDKVKQIKQEAINSVITGALMNSQIKINTKEIDKMTNEINLLAEQYWATGQGVEQRQQELGIKAAEQRIEQLLKEKQIDVMTIDRIINGVKTVGGTFNGFKK